ncbi:MAG: 6-phosphofructokinase, partial [Anaerolineaceae bacterium]|nr:6-phosphofructokinase [Anaerolineaceae bacterium]
MKKRIGVLTGGGDVPGLNPAMKEVVLNALDFGYDVVGFRRGWGGLLWYDINDSTKHDELVVKLTRNDVRSIDRTGGTFLHTSRTNPQKVKAQDVPEFLANSDLGKVIDENGTMDYTDHVLKV